MKATAMGLITDKTAMAKATLLWRKSICRGSPQPKTNVSSASTTLEQMLAHLDDDAEEAGDEEKLQERRRKSSVAESGGSSAGKGICPPRLSLDGKREMLQRRRPSVVFTDHRHRQSFVAEMRADNQQSFQRAGIVARLMGLETMPVVQPHLDSKPKRFSASLPYIKPPPSYVTPTAKRKHVSKLSSLSSPKDEPSSSLF